MIEEEQWFEPAFLVLTNQGRTGYTYLADIAHRDIFGLSNKILDHLSRTELIIVELIIPTLIEDVMDQNLNRHRDLSLAALNRLAPLLNQPSVLEELTSLLLDSTIDKKLLLSTIRCSGALG